jgi:uncharacterized protein
LGTQAKVRWRRAVLDTNVLVSTFAHGGGRWDWLRFAITAGQVVPLANTETIRELMRVLAYPKFKLTRDDITTTLENYLPYCEVINIPRGGVELPPCRDPGDIKFLQLARAGKADVLITGDSDLLVLAEVFTVPIITPADFRRLMGS